MISSGASQIKLASLVRHDIVQVGDVLAYRRSFTSSSLIVEKDVLVSHGPHAPPGTPLTLTFMPRLLRPCVPTPCHYRTGGLNRPIDTRPNGPRRVGCE